MEDTKDKKFTLNGKTVWLVKSPDQEHDNASCNSCVFDHSVTSGLNACPYNEEENHLECTNGLEVQHFTYAEPEPSSLPTVNQSVNSSALNVQVGGEHYKNLAIQPVAYNHANNLSFLEGNVVKYITRHKTKNKAQDIRKIIHYCTLILQLEYNETYEQESK